MKVAAIICEYNPMHLSHVYHIEKTREILGKDTGIVCIIRRRFCPAG